MVWVISLSLVLYAFDAFISVVHDETPNVRTDELSLRFPEPESVFMASSADAWRAAHAEYSCNSVAPYSVSVTLASLFCNVVSPIPLPRTLMGRFVILHGKYTILRVPLRHSANRSQGILQHAWRSKRMLLENASPTQDSSLIPYYESKQAAINNSLRKWKTGWPESLLDFEPFPEHPSLYQDRAEVCWYLAGVIMVPRANIATRGWAQSPSDSLSIQRILERILILSDRNQLHYGDQGFETVYDMIIQEDPARAGNDALGTLFYREQDTTKARFED